jgi:hypothetical protein
MNRLNAKKSITPWAFYRFSEVKKSYNWLIKFIERHEYKYFIPTEELPKIDSYQWKLNSKQAYQKYFQPGEKEKYKGFIDYERQIRKLHPELIIKG